MEEKYFLTVPDENIVLHFSYELRLRGQRIGFYRQLESNERMVAEKVLGLIKLASI